jgi:integrase
MAARLAGGLFARQVTFACPQRCRRRRKGDLCFARCPVPGLTWNEPQSCECSDHSQRSRGRREAIVPLYDDLRAVLARIPKLSPTILTNILTNTRARLWTINGFMTAYQRNKLKDRDLHFHDLRGTAATKFYVAGLSIRVIAEILAWSEEQVERIIRRGLTRSARYRLQRDCAKQTLRAAGRRC